MVGMRLSALRLPFIAGGEPIFWCVVVGQSSDAKRAARTTLFVRAAGVSPLPAVRGGIVISVKVGHFKPAVGLLRR